MMNEDRDYCKNREESLDPNGCFHMCHSTGRLGRIWVWIVGCPRFQILDSWRVDAGDINDANRHIDGSPLLFLYWSSHRGNVQRTNNQTVG